MAYIQHGCFGNVGASAPDMSRRLDAPVLTPLEFQVVALAGREPLSSLATGRRPIARALFGIEPAKALANPRLEALRRFVVLHRHGRREASAAAVALVSIGFSRRLLNDVRALVTVSHAPPLIVDDVEHTAPTVRAARAVPALPHERTKRQSLSYVPR